MRSRLLREGSLGLLILGGILGLSGLFFWIMNFRVGEQSYHFTVKFDDAGGLLDGAAVRLRGVNVGRIDDIHTKVDAVEVRVSIDSSKILIPVDSQFTSTQTGLIGQTTLDIIPSETSASSTTDERNVAGPLDKDCDGEMIVCDRAIVQGDVGVSYSQLVKRVDGLLSSIGDGELTSNLNSVAASVTEVANSVAELSNSIQEDLDFEAISGAVSSIQLAADSLNELVEENQATLTSTLGSLQVFSQDASEISAALKPLIVEGNFVRDLGTFTSQAAIASESALAATEDLKAITASLNDPDLVLTFRTTLDSARVTFENAEKITTDLDVLTGDLEFLESVKSLVLGLDGLVSHQPQIGDRQLLLVDDREMNWQRAKFGFTPVKAFGSELGTGF